jgi:hypothetical protein
MAPGQQQQRQEGQEQQRDAMLREGRVAHQQQHQHAGHEVGRAALARERADARLEGADVSVATITMPSRCAVNQVSRLATAPRPRA